MPRKERMDNRRLGVLDKDPTRRVPYQIRCLSGRRFTPLDASDDIGDLASDTAEARRPGMDCDAASGGGGGGVLGEAEVTAYRRERNLADIPKNTIPGMPSQDPDLIDLETQRRVVLGPSYPEAVAAE